MEDYGDSTYGDRVAPVYDSWYSDVAPEMIERLASLAGDGPVLELGIGTGRVAIPLAQRGLDIRGVDASPAMVSRLRNKPGGEAIPVAIGDFGGFEMEDAFSLVFVVFNTFFGLLDQDRQVECFRRVADHLQDGGRFILECFVPDLTRFDRDQRVNVNNVGAGDVRFDLSIYDPVGQRVDSQHVVLTERGFDIFPVSVRYAWPSELDLMARIAGLELEVRWGGWSEETFTGSGKHVSVYRRKGI